MRYAASLFYESERSDCTEGLWEERIILISAMDEKEAKAKAISFGEKEVQPEYTVQDGTSVRWRFRHVDRIYLIDHEIADGAELFSRFLRNSEVKSLLIPFDDLP